MARTMVWNVIARDQETLVVRFPIDVSAYIWTGQVRTRHAKDDTVDPATLVADLVINVVDGPEVAGGDLVVTMPKSVTMSVTKGMKYSVKYETGVDDDSTILRGTLDVEYGATE